MCVCVFKKKKYISGTSIYLTVYNNLFFFIFWPLRYKDIKKENSYKIQSGEKGVDLNEIDPPPPPIYLHPASGPAPCQVPL